MKKNTQNNLLLPLCFPLLLAILLFFGGCSDSSSEKEIQSNAETSSKFLEKTEEKTPVVKVISVEEKNFAPELSISGTVLANKEITIASEASGTVSSVWKQEGEKIEQGEAILNIDAGNNLLLSAYDSALIAKENSKYALHLQKQSSEKEIENAVISGQLAQKQYRKEKNGNTAQKNSIESQIKNAEAQKELAEKNLEISKNTLSQMIENETKMQKNILENTINTTSQSLVNFRSILNTTDELLGASEINKNTNNEFEVYLEGTTVGILLPVQDLWRTTNPQIENIESRFRAFEKEEYTKEDEEKILTLSKEAEEGSKKIRIILRKIEEMLKESIASNTFSQTKIDAIKAQIVQQQNLLEQNISQITALQQALSDFHIQSPQRITNAKMQVSVSESQVLSSENTLQTLKNSGDVQFLGVDFGVVQAKNNLQTALNVIESIRLKTQLAIQSSKAQYDSSNAMVKQTEISLSKLTIRSGLNGTITQILKQEGDTVSMGTPIAVVADFSSLKLQGDISIKERLLIEEGMSATVKIEEIDEELEGKISLIYPEADKLTKRVSLEITIPNEKNIPANIFATAKINLKKEEKKIFIPNSSIQGENPFYIFVAVPEQNQEIKKYTLQKREIEIGRENTTTGEKEILSGLTKGDILIKEKNRNISEGESVEVEF